MLLQNSAQPTGQRVQAPVGLPAAPRPVERDPNTQWWRSTQADLTPLVKIALLDNQQVASELRRRGFVVLYLEKSSKHNLPQDREALEFYRRDAMSANPNYQDAGMSLFSAPAFSQIAARDSLSRPYYDRNVIISQRNL